MKQSQNGFAASAAAKAAGVTLIELLVSLSITAILLTVALPSLSSFMSDSRLSSRTFDLVGAMNLARSEAIKRGAWVTLCKTTHPDSPTPACESGAGWEGGWIVFTDNNQDIGNQIGVIDGTDQIIKVFSGEERITITAGNSYSQGIAFNANGLGLGIKADGSTGTASNTFNLCLNGKGTSIITNRSGRIRIGQGEC